MIAVLGPLPAGNESIPKYRQISDHLQGLIERGELAPGMRLPAITALAKQWGTNYFTVHSALTPLENEGLIQRTPRGTFVRNRDTQLTVVAIYFGCNPWDDIEGTFYQQLYRELQAELDRRKIRIRIFIDDRRPEKQVTPLADLVRAIELRELQGIIGLMLNPRDITWLQAIGVPHAFLFGLGMDHEGKPIPGPGQGAQPIVKVALQRLARDGCQTVGMIIQSTEDIYAEFFQTAQSHGLRTRAEWLKRRYIPLTCRSEHFAYAAFKEIWAQRERPDGLVLYPDWVCRGAITAMLELGVKIPEDLRLVLYRNAGLDYLCPWPVPAIVTDVRSTAESLILRLNRPEVLEPLLIPFEMIG